MDIGAIFLIAAFLVVLSGMFLPGLSFYGPWRWGYSASGPCPLIGFVIRPKSTEPDNRWVRIEIMGFGRSFCVDWE